MPIKTQRSSSYTSCILIAQEEIRNIKPQFCSDSIQSIALPKTEGLFSFCFFKTRRKFLSDQCARSLITLSAMQESGWHHLFSIQIPLWSQMKGSFAIILSPLQIYCTNFKGRTFLEIKCLGRPKGRNIPEGQMSFIRYWTPTAAVTHTQTTHFWAT